MMIPLPWALLVLLASGLPGFDQFQKADQNRREHGQWETAESAALLRIEPDRIAAAVAAKPEDTLRQWGAAELLGSWTNRQAHFETALRLSGTNGVIALRYGCVAAHQGQTDLANRLLLIAQAQDPSNAVPWIVRAWLQRNLPPASPAPPLPPASAILFADGAPAAIRARVHLLQALGYSPYAARRIGHRADLLALPMTRELGQRPGPLADWLTQVAIGMQRSPTLIVTELVGQTVENSLGASADRVADLKDRRQDLLELIETVGRDAVSQAREPELVRYFDQILLLGEETALKRLRETVQGQR